MAKKTQKKTPISKRALLLRRFEASWRTHIVRTPNNPHHTFRLTRPRLYVPTSRDVRAVWTLLTDVWRFILRNKRILLGLGAIYAVLAYFLVGGISQFDYVAFKDAALQVTGGDVGAIGNALSLFGSAITGNLNQQPSEVQQFLSTALMLFFWLALIWATRMLSADKEIKLRDTFYNSGTAVVPTLVVLSVIALQLVPGALGIFAYVTALNGGWLTGGVETMAFAGAAVLLSLLSAYFVVSSLTALVVVSLPGTYPWQALRAAREMVINRRWSLVLRILALAVHIVIIWAVIMIPIFLLDNWLRFDWLPLVPIFVQALLGFTLVYTTVYIYKLYRSLL